MSNLYVSEPATSGKVIVDTTLGEIEIELFAKETPKACRNFIALIMEGYYDGVIFHRVVPGFIAQTGDPSGTGMGGESVYGEPFENEIHSRLKFNRRGLIAMANDGGKTSNTSQWFITLDRADELQGKHTLFGKINGPTIYNVLKVGQLELDKQERPLFPPKITGIRIIDNPFTDIVPRISAAERREQAEARLEAAREREQRESRKKAKKNTGLLSFGEAAEDAGPEVGIKKKAMTRPDLIDPDTSMAPAQQYVQLPASLANIGKGGESAPKKRKASEHEAPAEDLSAIRAGAAESEAAKALERQAAIDRMQAKLRKLDKARAGSDSDDSDDSSSGKPAKNRRAGPSFLDQELAKYSAGRRGKRKPGKRDEDDLLSALSSFTGKLRRVDRAETEEERKGLDGEGEGGGDEGIEVDDDVEWMSHLLKAAKDDGEETRRAESDYTVIDPRAKMRALKEEKRSSKGGRR